MDGSKVKVQNRSWSSNEDLPVAKRTLSRYQHVTDEHGTSAHPDIEDFDLVGELQKRLSPVITLRKSKKSLTSKGSKSQSLVEELRENAEPKKSLLSRFRAAVRLVILAGTLPYYEPKADKHGELKRGIPTFNVAYYYRPKTDCNVPHPLKVIMSRPPWLRTEEDRDSVLKFVLTLDVFDRYPATTLQKMAPHLNYQFVHANRVVIRQGHAPSNFYVVLSGSLIVQREEKDLNTDAVVSRLLGKLKPGDTFGEISLINNIPRTMTITTRCDSELLSLHKEEFDLLLKAKAQYEFYGKSRAIEGFKEFHMGWTCDERVDCSNYAQLVNYKGNKIIVGDELGYPQFLYFIVSGHCRVVEMLKLKCDRLTLGVSLSQVSPTEDESLMLKNTQETIVQRFVQIMELYKGQYFGCGEDLCHRYVIAVSNVQCLEIPHTYLRRKGYFHWLEFLKDKLDVSSPTHEYVFHKFVEQASWRAYKKQLIAETVRRTRRKAPTNIMEVPQSIRLAEESADWNNVSYMV